MQLNRIIIKPSDQKLVIQYVDSANRTGNVVMDTTNNAAIAAVIAEAQQRLPTPANRPDKPQILEEIAALTARVQALKESIGQA